MWNVTAIALWKLGYAVRGIRSMKMSPYILNCGVAQSFVWKETILDEDKCKIHFVISELVTMK
jgi:hypothetical protein